MKNEIVFIDDNKASLESLLDYLEVHTDLSISLFNEAESAIKYIKKTPHIVAILIDLHMPKIDGQFIAEKISNLNLNIPLIILTVVSPEKNFLKECYEKGIIDYIEKPKGLSEHFIVTQKLKIFDELYTSKRMLEEEKKYREQVSSKFEKLNSTYIDLIDQTKTAMLVVNDEGLIVGKNELYDKIIPQSQEIFIQNIHEDFLNPYNNLIKEIVESKEARDCNLMLKNGRWININGTNVYNGTIAFLVKDITMRMTQILDQQKGLKEKVQDIRRHLSSQLD